MVQILHVPRSNPRILLNMARPKSARTPLQHAERPGASPSQVLLADSDLRPASQVPVPVKEAAIAMIAAGATPSATARKLQMSRMTLASIVRQAEQDGSLPAFNDRMRAKLETIVEDTADANIAQGGAVDPVSWGISFDKLRLLQSEPTEIVEVRDSGIDHLSRMIDAINSGASVIDVEATVTRSGNPYHAVESEAAKLDQPEPKLPPEPKQLPAPQPAEQPARPKFRRTP